VRVIRKLDKKAILESKLGGECITNDDCLIESNTICLEGLCQCALGFIPEPMHGGFNQSSTYVVEHCIAGICDYMKMRLTITIFRGAQNLTCCVMFVCDHDLGNV
jgi:hypothetical protein